MKQKQLFILSFFLLLFLIFFQLFGIFRLFLSPIAWASVLALVFYPPYQGINRLLKGRRNLASFLMAFFVVGLTLGPIIFFSSTLVKEILDFHENLKSWMTAQKYIDFFSYVLGSPLKNILDRVAEKLEFFDIQLVPLMTQAMKKLSQSFVDQVQHGAKNFFLFIINYGVTLFIFFFFLRDGESMSRALKDIFPMARENKEMILQRLSGTVSAVVRGIMVTGFLQALLAGLAFWILGVPFPVLLALLIAFLSLIPIGGAVLVWLPSSVYLFLSGFWIKALILFFWGLLVVSMVDNFVKPLLIGGKTRLPTLFLFLSILGGLAFYGFIGVFIGPVMLALFLVLIDIYRKEYSDNTYV